MAEVKTSDVKPVLDLGGTSNQGVEMSWRRTLAGIGVFLLFVSLFAAAGAKGALGSLPMYVAILALIILAVAAVAGVVASMGARKTGTAAR